jgi:hypothetical protein
LTCTYLNALRGISVKAVSLCIADAPVLSYTVTSAYIPGVLDVDLTWVDAASGNSTIAQNLNLPMSGQLLWPQVTTAGGVIGGQASAWPGWQENPDGSYTDLGSPLRAGIPPEATIVFSVNPTQTVEVLYPPAVPTCTASPRAALGDRVWEDVDPNATTTPGYLAGDGLQNDPAEQGVSGIKVELWSPGGDGVIGGSDDSLVATTTTDSQGDYNFGDVMPGVYYLVFTNPTGSGAWSTNFQVGSDPTIDSDVNVDTSDPTKARTDLITLGAGDNDLTWDAAIVSTSVLRSSDLGDFVWNDINKNGIQDPNEPGLPGLQVQLFLVGNSDASGASVNDTLIATDTTDANGIYGFQALDPATYYVVVEVKNGYTVSPQFSGSNPAVDSNINSVGRSANVVLPDFTSDLTIDAGMYETPTVDPIPDEPGSKRLYLPTVIK